MKQTEKIMTAGLKGHQAQLTKCNAEGTQLHKQGCEGKLDRAINKVQAKANWFKPQPSDPTHRPVHPSKKKHQPHHHHPHHTNSSTHPSSVIWVPRTPDGRLASHIRDIENKLQMTCSKKIRIAEENGQPLWKQLQGCDLENLTCSRERCLTCTNPPEKGPSRCRVRSVTYENQCLICKRQGISTKYFGETSRTSYERQLEHIDDAKEGAPHSHI